jgi:hypothetical protein
MEKKVNLPRTKAVNMEELPAQTVMDFFSQGIPITETPEHVVLKKSNDAIRVKGNTLGLLPRKVVDACFYIGRQTEQTSAVPHSGMYSVSYDYFAWLIDYNSNNVAHLKRKIVEIMESPIEINIIDANNPSKDFWLVANFLSDACITNGRVYFGIPESIKQTILNPRSFTNLSFRIQHGFPSLYAYILYQACRSELFRGVTDWWDMAGFRTMMNTDNRYSELQDFQKRVLRPAMDQINGVPGKYTGSDICITPDYQFKGRTKTHIRFFVVANPEFAGSLEDKEKLPREIYETLKSEFGFANSQVDAAAKYPIEYLSEKIEFARYRIKSAAKNKKPINNPTKYLLNALEEDLRFNEGERSLFENERKAVVVRQEEAEVQAGGSDDLRAKGIALEAFKALDEAKQSSLLAEFKLSPEFEPVKSVVKSELTVPVALKNALVRIAFTGWLQGE